MDITQTLFLLTVLVNGILIAKSAGDNFKNFGWVILAIFINVWFACRVFAYHNPSVRDASTQTVDGAVGDDGQ